MARPTTRDSPPAGEDGAPDEARTEAVDHDPPVGPDGDVDGFVFAGPETEAVADDP